ncbi:MAG: hypothetical protein ACT4PV_09050 [Planctomycetaceae bacterium]
MFSRGIVAICVLGAVGASGCHEGSSNLFRFEISYLREDVVDLLRIAFQSAENAYLGDPVAPADLIDPADSGNGFTAAYTLPPAVRPGLGFGDGRATRRVLEDGVAHPEPESFRITGTAAARLQILFTLRYVGETRGGRITQVDLTVSLDATRTAPGEYEVVYLVDGDCLLGATFALLRTEFRAPGRPADGLDPSFGDGSGIIDDPGVYAPFDLDLDWLSDGFRAEGDVGCCSTFREFFRYEEVR